MNLFEAKRHVLPPNPGPYTPEEWERIVKADAESERVFAERSKKRAKDKRVKE